MGELKGEIGSQTWNFDPKIVARMLSPKRRSQCLIEKSLIQTCLEDLKAGIQPPAEWAGKGERASYIAIKGTSNSWELVISNIKIGEKLPIIVEDMTPLLVA